MAPLLSRLHTRKQHIGGWLLLVFALALLMPLPGDAASLPTPAEVAGIPCENQPHPHHHAPDAADPADTLRCHAGGCLQCSHCPALTAGVALPLPTAFMSAPTCLPMAGVSCITRLDRPPKSLLA